MSDICLRGTRFPDNDLNDERQSYSDETFNDHERRYEMAPEYSAECKNHEPMFTRMEPSELVHWSITLSALDERRLHPSNLVRFWSYASVDI